MEFEGTVYKVLPQVKGTGAKGEWKKQEVVFELTGEFSRKVCVGFWGDKADDAAKLVPGEQVEVMFNLDSREYNGRWFTEARAWKFTRHSDAATPPPAPTPFSEPVDYDREPADDLPF